MSRFNNFGVSILKRNKITSYFFYSLLNIAYSMVK